MLLITQTNKFLTVRPKIHFVEARAALNPNRISKSAHHNRFSSYLSLNLQETPCSPYSGRYNGANLLFWTEVISSESLTNSL